MKSVRLTTELVRTLAELTRIYLNAASSKQMRGELLVILRYVQRLQRVSAPHITSRGEHAVCGEDVVRVPDWFDAALIRENIPNGKDGAVHIAQTFVKAGDER